MFPLLDRSYFSGWSLLGKGLLATILMSDCMLDHLRSMQKLFKDGSLLHDRASLSIDVHVLLWNV